MGLGEEGRDLGAEGSMTSWWFSGGRRRGLGGEVLDPGLGFSMSRAEINIVGAKDPLGGFQVEGDL